MWDHMKRTRVLDFQWEKVTANPLSAGIAGLTPPGELFSDEDRDPGVRCRRSPQEIVSTPFKKSLDFRYFAKIHDFDGDQTCKIAGLYGAAFFDRTATRFQTKPLLQTRYERNGIGKPFCPFWPGFFSRKKGDLPEGTQ